MLPDTLAPATNGRTMNAFARSALPLLLTAAGLAQDLAAQEIRFESGVTNIHVDVLVKRNGQSVRGLTRDDFVVRDEGESRPLVAFAEEPVPLDLVLLMDMTWSGFNRGERRERDLMKDMFAAGSNALKQMRPYDRAAIRLYHRSSSGTGSHGGSKGDCRGPEPRAHA
jgi:hypothetical protein